MAILSTTPSLPQFLIFIVGRSNFVALHIGNLPLDCNRPESAFFCTGGRGQRAHLPWLMSRMAKVSLAGAVKPLPLRRAPPAGIARFLYSPCSIARLGRTSESHRVSSLLCVHWPTRAYPVQFGSRIDFNEVSHPRIQDGRQIAFDMDNWFPHAPWVLHFSVPASGSCLREPAGRTSAVAAARSIRQVAPPLPQV
mgnify:CR=1 FL=1|jgi:hypothetical protein